MNNVNPSSTAGDERHISKLTLHFLRHESFGVAWLNCKVSITKATTQVISIICLFDLASLNVEKAFIVSRKAIAFLNSYRHT